MTEEGLIIVLEDSVHMAGLIIPLTRVEEYSVTVFRMKLSQAVLRYIIFLTFALSGLSRVHRLASQFHLLLQ